jgi:hypothetical protein
MYILILLPFQTVSHSYLLEKSNHLKFDQIYTIKYKHLLYQISTNRFLH